MLQVARDGQYETHVKVLSSRLCLAEKMAVISPVVAPAVWFFAGSLERLRLPRNLNRIQWAEGDITYKIAKRKEIWEWKKLEFMELAVLSLTNLLRVGEAGTISWPADGKVCFVGEKSGRGDYQ